jgi:hypothetical protein
MAKSNKGLSAAPDIPKEQPSVRLRFPKGGGVSPKGFDTAVVGEDVVITVRGKVTEMRARDGEQHEWDSGKTIEVQMTACKIAGPAKPIDSMEDAIEASEMRL